MGSPSLIFDIIIEYYSYFGICMEKTFFTLIEGYQVFREKYAIGDNSIMRYLSQNGQQPQAMVVACCDSRVDPALILQCDPGDLFVTRNVANIVPPFEKDDRHHGTSAALEFGICFLKVQHLILLGHSQCGGIQALFNEAPLEQDDFISNWVSIIKKSKKNAQDIDELSKRALNASYENCLTFPWIKERVENKTLCIHLWFFDIKKGKIFVYSPSSQQYEPLSEKHPFIS